MDPVLTGVLVAACVTIAVLASALLLLSMQVARTAEAKDRVIDRLADKCMAVTDAGIQRLSLENRVEEIRATAGMPRSYPIQRSENDDTEPSADPVNIPRYSDSRVG